MHTNETYIVSDFFNTEVIDKLNTSFNNAKPFRFIVVDDFLTPDFAEQIALNFPPINSMKTQYKGLNENKAEDSSFDKFSYELQQLNAFLHSPALIEWVSKITGLTNLSTIVDRLGAGLHQGGNNSFLDIHVDYNIHPIKKKQRKLNLLIYFNHDWQPNWGGQLELWDKQNLECFAKIQPIFNRMVLFECNEISYHGYNRINCPNSVTRKSYYHYFFQQISEGIQYHDTVFLPLPSDSLGKRVLMPIKEFMKNKTKLLFYKIGFSKFLK